jgi:hypothetical protein
MISQWEAYIEDLCKSNTDIRHEKLDGAKQRRSWFAYTDGESPVANSNAASPYVSHNHFQAAGRAGTQWIYTSELAILVNISPTKTNPAEIKTARALAFSIAQQMDAKILQDIEEGDACAFIEDFLESEITPLDMTDQTAFGCLLTIKFAKDRPSVDPAKWTEV